MVLNLNMSNDYRFTQGRFVSVESGKEYKFRISKDDRFYDYMRKYISNGKVDSMVKVGIDELFVKDSDTTFHKE
ncbi:MAG: hypothetical protein HDR71_17970 [Lachnospiraceae bacterium]|nr:hypothetical protein [Lachnospiraceae bacterium]